MQELTEIPRKNLKVNSSLKKIGEYLYEARLKRSITQAYLSTYLNIPQNIINLLETDNKKIPIKYFFSYIHYLNFDKAIISQIKIYNKRILFEIYNYKIKKTAKNEIRLLNKIISYMVIIRKFKKLKKDIISDRSGIPINIINEIENFNEEISLSIFLSYCNAIGMLDIIVDSLSFKFDEIGNFLIVKKLKDNEEQYV